MAWPGPVRSVLSAGERFVDRVLCVIGAVLLSQAPEFMQQYLQRLGGHLDEAQRQLNQFRAAAAQSGLSLEDFARRTSANSDPSIAKLGSVVLAARDRVIMLLGDQQAIRSATPLERPFVFVRHADPSIAHATWSAFRPAVPTTVEGLLYAAVGVILALALYHGAVRLPIQRVWRRRHHAHA